MSQDHRPIYPSEKRRVEELGGYIDDGYLNGVLSVSRALGDWDMKFPRGSPSPLIAEPEFRQVVLSEDDEFLIIGCDGIWDKLSSQQAVSLVRRGLRRHDDPEQCARDLVMEALRLNTIDNLTVIIVCLSSLDHCQEPSPPRQRKMRCCSLSAEALCSLRSLLDGSANSWTYIHWFCQRLNVYTFILPAVECIYIFWNKISLPCFYVESSWIKSRQPRIITVFWLLQLDGRKSS